MAKDKERLYFIHELKVARLLDYPLMVRTYEVHDIGTSFIIIMDYIEGVHLLQYIKLKKRLQESVAIHIAHQILRSVRNLHELGYVHRDIKPQNVMLKVIRDEKNIDFKEKYEVILIDFGLCADYRDFSP